MEYRTAERSTSTIAASDELRPLEDVVNYVKEYTKERPDIVLVVAFGIGFILGWKLKPW